MNAPYINIHTHRRTGCGIEVVSAMAGCGEFPPPPFSIGVHPWQLVDLNEAGLAEALHEIGAAPAWAIGETGLDYAIEADRDRQADVFSAQLRIAVERRLPVVLHCVRAFEPTMDILTAYTLPAVIFHGFIGSLEQAARVVRSGYYISLGERSLSSPKTVEALRSIPLENLFFETDNAQVSIAEIYSRAGEILAMPVPELVTQLHENYERLVGTH